MQGTRGNSQAGLQAYPSPRAIKDSREATSVPGRTAVGCGATACVTVLRMVAVFAEEGTYNGYVVCLEGLSSYVLACVTDRPYTQRKHRTASR